MDTTLNQRLRQYFDNTGLSQKEIAKSVNTSEQTISLTLSGKTTPKSDLLERICKVYDVNPTWLITGEGQMKRSENGISLSNKPKDNGQYGNEVFERLQQEVAYLKQLIEVKDKLISFLERGKLKGIFAKTAFADRLLSKKDSNLIIWPQRRQNRVYHASLCA
jgi:transcriptional regulator with XRE-family HTH domain